MSAVEAAQRTGRHGVGGRELLSELCPGEEWELGGALAGGAASVCQDLEAGENGAFLEGV